MDRAALEPKFLNDLHDLLAPAPFDYYVTCGYRSIEESNRLYDEFVNGVVLGRKTDGTLLRGKKGPRAAIGGKSAHNYGLAIDVSLDGDTSKPGLQQTWDTKMAGWTWLKAAVFKHPRLHSLWNIGDWPHIERLNWRDYVAWKRLTDDNIAVLRVDGISAQYNTTV